MNYDTLKIVLVTALAALIVIRLVVGRAKSPSAARKRFFALMDSLPGLVRLVESVSKNPGISAATRNQAATSANRFAWFGRINRNRPADWLALEASLKDLKSDMCGLVVDMKKEVALAEEAERCAPGLLRRLPARLDDIASDIADGVVDPEMANLFRIAQAAFVSAKDKAQDRPYAADSAWVEIHALLKWCEANCDELDIILEQTREDSGHSAAVPKHA